MRLVIRPVAGEPPLLVELLAHTYCFTALECILLGKCQAGLFLNIKPQEVSEPRRILSIDGGGIRCMIALEVLKSLDDQIIEKTGDSERRLCAQFDLIAGTSAGAILAAAVSMDSLMSEVRTFVLDNAKLSQTDVQACTLGHALSVLCGSFRQSDAAAGRGCVYDELAFDRLFPI